jgi:hypothetical protein
MLANLQVPVRTESSESQANKTRDKTKYKKSIQKKRVKTGKPLMRPFNEMTPITQVISEV